MNSQCKRLSLRAVTLICVGSLLPVGSECCIAQTTATATQPAPVAGMLLDPNGKPLANVEVRLAGSNASVVIADGKFTPWRAILQASRFNRLWRQSCPSSQRPLRR
jgi:hypothetical protein